MPNTETHDLQATRHATLKLMQHEGQQVLSARMPAHTTAEEFGRAASGAFNLVSKLTGHPCMSGRIKFVVEDMFLNEVTRVDLRTGQMT
jgi:hypothetical protein